MKKTTNYQLNQWEKTDRILMDDFNADNAKLDAALLSKLGPIEDILTYTQSEASVSPPIIIPLPEDLDWGKWSVILMDATFQTTSNSSTNDIRLELTDAQNGTITGGYCSFQGSTRTVTMLVVLFPARNGDAPGWGLYFPGGEISVSERKLREAVQLRTSMTGSGSRYLKGTTVRLRGIR